MSVCVPDGSKLTGKSLIILRLRRKINACGRTGTARLNGFAAGFDLTGRPAAEADRAAGRFGDGFERFGFPPSGGLAFHEKKGNFSGPPEKAATGSAVFYRLDEIIARRAASARAKTAR